MSFLDLVFPKICLDCGKENGYICPDCVAKVKFSNPICPYCEKLSIGGTTHPECSRRTGLDGLTAVWEYEGIIRKAILSLKYKYSTEVGKELTDYLIKWLLRNRKLLPDTQCLVPVPMFWYKENVRGFNQSTVVGKSVADKMEWKFEPNLLTKKKSTTSQVELKGDQRRRNLKSAFSLNPSQFVNYRSLVLFDDVFTTGSTLREAARVLKLAGAQRVWGLTIAR